MRTAAARQVWDGRYRGLPGNERDRDPEATWQRVAAAMAEAEPRQRGQWRKRFHALMADQRFLPGGRVLAGAGVANHLTLCNCFVMGALHDDLDSVLGALKEGALTLRAGGGIGCDFSPLRHPVPYLKLWDAMSGAVASDARGGAMMATLRCDHPDIVRFASAKAGGNTLRHCNCSVLASDAFMAAVAAGASWPLVFAGEGTTSVQAGELWDAIIANVHGASEPGLLFVDRINAENNLHYAERLSATNPCAEVPLPAYGVCDLGSFNLTAFVRDAFRPKAWFDHDALAECVPTAVRMLDDVLSISAYPLQQQRHEAHATRRLGIGFMGLASALVMLGIRYDSDAGRRLAADVTTTLRDAAYGASATLARERGPFPRFHRARYLESAFVRRLPRTLRLDIGAAGMRNSHLMAIAPTGSIALLADNVSSGIEPIFRAHYQRRVPCGAFATRRVSVDDFACQRWRAGGRSGTPPALVTARELSAEDHLAMQAAVQPLVDQGISKTVNVPQQTEITTISGLYRRAFELGLKGITVFRPAARQRGPLQAVREPAAP